MSDSPVFANRAGRKPGQRNRYSMATMTRDICEAIHASLYIDGNPTQYFRDLKKKNPALYLQAVLLLAKKGDVDANAGGLVINVVQLSTSPQPTPGVLASPVAEHIAPQRRLELVERTGG
jgi:hypothetical protein